MALPVQTRILLRTNTLANWQSHNIVLLNGELAVVSCDNQIRFKVGNGLSTFNQLPFVDQSQLSTIAVYANAISQGTHASTVPYGLAAGSYLSAGASFSQVLGVDARSLPTDQFSFVWNGDTASYGIGEYYDSHGEGTFNINPKDGLSGFYIGNEKLGDVLLSSGSKVFIKDSSVPEYADGKQTDLSVFKISNDDYEELVLDGQTLSNAVYIISAGYVETYNQQIKNVADATDNDDAANLGQVLSAVNYAINNIANLNVSNSLTIGNVTITESDLSALKMLALQAPALLSTL